MSCFKPQMHRIILSSAIIAFFLAVVIYLFQLPAGEMTIEVMYDPGEMTEDNNIDTVYIKDISVGTISAGFNEYNDVEFNEKHGSYVWAGDKDVIKLSMSVEKQLPVRFTMGFYKKRDGNIGEADILVNIISEGQSQTKVYHLNSFDKEEREFSSVDMRSVLPKVLFSFFLLWIILFFVMQYLKKQMPMVLKLLCSGGLCVAGWSLAVKLWIPMWIGMPFRVFPDTGTYLIDNVSQLNWVHRMPGYQLFILGIKKVFRCSSMEELYECIANVQMLLGVFSCVIFYKIVKMLCRYCTDTIAIVITCIYASIPDIICWERSILTESVAIVMTIILVFLLLSWLKKPTKQLGWALGAMALIMTLTRPSFIIVPPILFVFFFMQFMIEKEERRQIRHGLAAVLACIAVLLAYCAHNQGLTGKFMLSRVAYDNQISILIEEGIYDNPSYPDITSSITELCMTNDDTLVVGILVIQEYGLPRACSYISDTRKLYFDSYIKICLNKIVKAAEDYLWLKGYFPMSDGQQKFFNILHLLFLPVNLAFCWFLCIWELVSGVRTWWIEKKAPWIQLGFPVFILCISFTSIVSQTHATIQRLCVCIIPLLYFMILVMIQRLFRADKLSNQS